MMFVTLTAVSVLIGLSVFAYLLPVLVGAVRRVPDLGAVAAINILLGWTMLGWVMALAMALRPLPPEGATVQLVQNLPPPGWGVGPYPPWEVPPAALPPAPPRDGPDPADGW